MSALATALILVPNDPQQYSDKESWIGMSGQQFNGTDISVHELVTTTARGGSKVELAAFETSTPKRNATAPRFRVQIAAVRDKADAHRVWTSWQTDHGAILVGQEPHFERAETSNGVFYRVQTGAFQSRGEAHHFCARLKDRDVTCFVVAL